MSVDLTAHFASDTARRIEHALSGGLWTTDADWTLWREDIGEAFLRQLIAEGSLVSPLARGVDVWTEYERRVAANKTQGYAFAVQVMEGLRESELRAKAEAFAAEFVPRHLLSEMRALLSRATEERSCGTWVVSASNQWIVEAAGKLIGLPGNRVMGIRVAVRGGLLTRDTVEPITCMAGKAAAIHESIGRAPSLVTGDSSGDFEMMELATDTAVLVVHPSRTDPALIKRARHSNWLIHEVQAMTS